MIARLKKELDEARTMLSSLERQAPMPATTAVSSNAYAISNGKRGSCFLFFIQRSIIFLDYVLL